jgi:hypothetical protein
MYELSSCKAFQQMELVKIQENHVKCHQCARSHGNIMPTKLSRHKVTARSHGNIMPTQYAVPPVSTKPGCFIHNKNLNFMFGPKHGSINCCQP